MKSHFNQKHPHRHHYIPSFYLSRWAIGEDRRLCQFSCPYKTVLPHRRHPNATGYVEKLYELKGLEENLANAVETHFFKPVDNAAADALSLMEVSGNRAQWDPRRRSGWSVFLHSLLLRTPEDVSAFKDNWRLLMQADELGTWQDRYEAIRSPDDPTTFKEYINNIPSEDHDRSAMNALVKILDGGNIARAINGMIWRIVDTSESDFKLLTSDRPIIRTNGLLIERGHLVLPIGPQKLFVAARDQATLNQILAMPLRQVVKECNRQVCDYAVKYVYGVDDSQLQFVAKHFATKDQPRLVRLSEKQRQEVANVMLNHNGKHNNPKPP